MRRVSSTKHPTSACQHCKRLHRVQAATTVEVHGKSRRFSLPKNCFDAVNLHSRQGMAHLQCPECRTGHWEAPIMPTQNSCRIECQL